MRWLVSTLLVLLVASAARAQAKGEVELIGYGGNYRGDCWTSMVVRLTPESSATAAYKIQVVQEDVDRDKVLYERPITLTGNSEGAVREQRFWMYFLPQATLVGGEHGLPQPAEGLDALRQKLRVFLCQPGPGGKQILQLRVTTTANNLEPYVTPTGSSHRGRKLILTVSDPDAPALAVKPDYASALGILEEVEMVSARPAELPENVLGYEPIDAVVMIGCDPASLKQPTDERMRALREWVRQGGHLVISQMPQWEKMLGWGDLLNVTYPRIGGENGIQGVAERSDLPKLREWATPTGNNSERELRDIGTQLNANAIKQWDLVSSTFKVGVVEAKPGAVVEDSIEWPKDRGLPATTPYLVRSTYGMGGVTFIAQDIGDPAITTRAKAGWEHIWDHIFGWKNDPYMVTPTMMSETSREPIEKAWGRSMATTEDLGPALLPGVEFPQKGAALVFLAIVFFIGYWVAAGPVAYFVLLSKKKSQLNWFVFGACAIVATVLTVLMVQLVLRGSPEVRHVSIVRMAHGEPTVVTSHIGLYIPRDGTQKIELKDTAVDYVSYISPLALPPQYVSDNEFPAWMEYDIPVRDSTADKPPTVTIPSRSTLKKLQAKWVGNMNGVIDGSAALLKPSPRNGYIEGTITNGTARELRNIYIVFRHHQAVETVNDWILYTPKLGKGQSLDLNKEFDGAVMMNFFAGNRVLPEDGKAVKGTIGYPGKEFFGFEPYWYKGMGGTNLQGEAQLHDWGDAVPKSFPMLSLFDRLPVVKHTETSGERFELLRRGARYLNVSTAELNGGLVVLAQSDDSPLPFPFSVEGQQVESVGRTYYQAVLPLDHSKVNGAATQPAEAVSQAE